MSQIFTADETRFTDLLLEKGLVTREALSRALRVQEKLENRQSLGEVLVGLKLLRRTQLRDLLQEYKRRIRLGDLLVEGHVITQAQLSEALRQQREQRTVPLGQLLIELGHIAERELLHALSEQQDLPLILQPSLALFDRAILNRVPLNFWRELHALPLSVEQGRLTLLISQFPSADHQREISTIFGRPLAFALSTTEAIDRLIDEYEATVVGGLGRTVLTTEEQSRALFDTIIQGALELGASDIHLEPFLNRYRLRYRVDGVLVHRTDMPRDLGLRVCSRCKVLGGLDIAEHRRHQDGRFNLTVGDETIDLRVSSYVTLHGENLVLRVLRKHTGLLSLEEIGMPQRLLERYGYFVLDAPAGVCIITGPTGSGKTTTLYSSIDTCNKIGIKIITAEDPVEYVLDGVMQCSINPKVGLTYGDTLKAIVRQDPDIIVLGEIRDAESARVAVQAALTGHKVFTTFHTEDAVGGLLRLMDMDIETFLISSTVICVVAQRLVRRVCQHCKEPAQPTEKDLYLLQLDREELREYRFWRGRGCPKCHYTGYRGRIAIFELLLLNEEVKDAILERKTSYYIREISIRRSGLITMQECGIARVLQGVTTFEEVLAEAPRSFKPRPIPTIFNLLGEDLSR